MDIDIDFLDRNEILSKISHISASRKEKDQLVKHNTGIYMHEVPFDCLKNISAIPYDQAEDLNYFKIDFLNVGIYKGVQNEQHLETLMNTEPLWDLLEQDEFVNLLFHVNGHADILKIMKPKSIEQLAAVMAMIRPAKRHLIGKDWNYVLEEVWKKPADREYYWKKSHAFAYAFAVVVQMNLICEQISYGYS
jgi:hypothetical protein